RSVTPKIISAIGAGPRAHSQAVRAATDDVLTSVHKKACSVPLRTTSHTTGFPSKMRERRAKSWVRPKACPLVPAQETKRRHHEPLAAAARSCHARGNTNVAVTRNAQLSKCTLPMARQY